MNGISVSQYYRAVNQQIRQEVVELDATQLEGTSVDQWIEYFMRQRSLYPIILKSVPPVVKPKVDKVQRKDPFDDVYTAEREVAVIGLPVEPNENMSDLLRMKAQRWLVPAPDWEYRDDCIFVEAAPTAEAAKKVIEQVKQLVGWLNEDIESGNKPLPDFIRELIQKRMETIGVRSEVFESLADALGAELTPSNGTTRRVTEVPQVRQSITELRRPQPHRKSIPRLKPEEFQTFLDVIEAQAVTFERTPRTVAKLEEDDIRNLILSNLNGAFNLGAVGEAFSNRGKTDIYLPVPDGGIFIAECKIWYGPHTVGEAIEQILGYLTWRDAYGVVLIFARNKEFSRIQKAIPEAINSIPSLRGEHHQTDEHHWLARHSLSDDEYNTVEIHYLVYNIYA